MPNQAGPEVDRVTLIGRAGWGFKPPVRPTLEQAVRFSANLYWSERLGGALAGVGSQPTPLGSWGAWQAAGNDLGSKVADPLFKDPAGGDFGLGVDSPALALGFEPLLGGLEIC